MSYISYPYATLCIVAHCFSQVPFFYEQEFSHSYSTVCTLAHCSCRLRSSMDWSSHMFHSYRWNFHSCATLEHFLTGSTLFGSKFSHSCANICTLAQYFIQLRHPSWGLISLYVYNCLHLGMDTTSSPIYLWNRQFITMFTRATSSIKILLEFFIVQSILYCATYKKKVHMWLLDYNDSFILVVVFHWCSCFHTKKVCYSLVGLYVV